MACKLLTQFAYWAVDYIERATFAKEFEKCFDFKVYGNDEWKKYVNCYEGVAEHFNQMPDIFNRSKINLNIVRTYV